MVFAEILDPVLRPLLSFGPFWAIFWLSLGITLLITLVYRFATDQDEMKRLKSKIKEHQKKIRELQKKDPQKAMKTQQKAMEDNLKYMKHSFRPTLYTFIPIIIIFGWMNANLVYEPLGVGVPFEVSAVIEGEGTAELYAIPSLAIENAVKPASGVVSWEVGVPEEGDYKLIVKHGGDEAGIDVSVGGTGYYEPSASFDGSVKELSVSLEKYRLGFSLFGWTPGWLGTYILLSILFSTLLRKILRVY